MSTTAANERPLAGEWIVRKFDWDRDLEKVLNLWSRSGEGVQLSASDQPDGLRK